MSGMTPYERLVGALEAGGARFRFIDHAPEGRTELVSALRGHHPRHAAKCLVLMVKAGKKVTKFVLAVVPGDKKVDPDAVKRLMGGTYAGFASTPDAERVTQCVTGTVLPFAFDGELTLIDELFTPDSSRFWEASIWREGEPQPAFDKQFVRDHLETLRWDKRPPGPELPDEVVRVTREKYLEAARRICGLDL